MRHARWEPSSPRAVRSSAGKRGFPNESFAKHYAKPGNEILKGTDFGWRSKSADHHSPGEGSFKDKPFSERYRSPANAKPGARKGMEKDRWFSSNKFEKMPPRAGHGVSPPSPRERIKQFEIRYQPPQLVMATKNSSTHVYSREELLKVYEAISKDGTLSMPPHANLEGIKAATPMAPYANRMDKESLMILAQLRQGSTSPREIQPASEGAEQEKDAALSASKGADMVETSATTTKADVSQLESEQTPALEAGKEESGATKQYPPTGIQGPGGDRDEEPFNDRQQDGIEPQQGPLHAQEQLHQPVVQQGWCYLDPQGHMQGPFTCEEILDWFDQGFFPANLPVRPSHLPAEAPFIPLVKAIPEFGPVGRAFLESRQQGVFTQTQKQLLMHQKQQQQELLQRQIQLQQMQLQQQQASLPPMEGLVPASRVPNGAQSISPSDAQGFMLGMQRPGYGQQPDVPVAAALGQPSHASLGASLQSMNLTGAEHGGPKATDLQATSPHHPITSMEGVQAPTRGRMLTMDEVESQQMQHASSTLMQQQQVNSIPGAQVRMGAAEQRPIPRPVVGHSVSVPGSASIQAPPPPLPGSVSSSPPRQTKQGWNVRQEDKPAAKSLAEIQREEAENAARARAALLEKQAPSGEGMAASVQTPWSQHSVKQMPTLSMREIQLEEERKAKMAAAQSNGPGMHGSSGGTSPWAGPTMGQQQPIRSPVVTEANRKASNAPGVGAQNAVSRTVDVAAPGRPMRTPAQSAWSTARGASAPSKSLKEIQEEETRRNATRGSVPASTLAARLGAQSAPNVQEEDDLLWDYGKVEQTARPPPTILSNAQSGWNTQTPLPTAAKHPAAPPPAVQPQPVVSGSTDVVQKPATAEPTLGHSISAEFFNWCKEQSLKLTGSDDMTLIDFLLGLQSSGEIAEYIQVYLGKSAAVSSFTAEFVRRKHAEEVRNPSQQGNASAIGSSEAGGPTHEQAKNKKGKRSRGKKVNPSQLLGFSSGISYESVERGV
uniref:GYF domain-containing protein n=1 Tax=Picocystis salinarum TaxID=88271 RepID=A0A7S3XB28_9CHLO|mmetsp:Transcript_9799/g.59631  ORF Transcript_9799/g.59631 Transcript_9799/m.59631 type:complete len:1002 (+) Transcript_9799:69-3074(+)